MTESNPQDRQTPDSTTTGADVLVVVHPNSALRGPALKLRLQWSLMDEWRGPVFIMDDDNHGTGASQAANTYRSIIDEIVDQREGAGLPCRFDAGDEEGLLESAVARLLEITDPGAHYTITGAWADGCVAAVARLVEQAGREASIDDSATWPDDVDEAADREMATRLADLMRTVRNE